MFVKALLAFIALPGVVAIAIPVIWLSVNCQTKLTQPLGLAPLIAGFLALLWCVRDFYISGKGTLAPWAPPSHLVIAGLYRYTRNPMYVAVTLALLGWAICFGAPELFAYSAVVAIAFHLRVVLGEEPWLAQKYGIQWQNYSSRIPRWFW
jgi:protein-S-isoprenylcysteine O-methyltransferase Ste14